MTGNSFWWSQVADVQETMPPGTYYKEAELEAFRKLYTRMRDEGMLQTDIIQHFKETFGIGMTAFYGRLRKVGKWHVV